MLKKIGFILMLASGMAIGAGECRWNDIDTDVIPKHCQLLNISKYIIEDEAARAIATVLKENDTLTKLDISKSVIEYEGVRELATALKDNKNIKLTELDLSWNKIEDTGAREMAQKIK